MQSTKIKGVSVAYSTLRGKSGFLQVEYTGLVGDAAVPHLWADLMVRTAQTPAILLKVDRALTAYETYPVVPSWVGRVCPGAIICRRDQYQTFCEMARSLVGRGVVRGVFLQSHAHLAMEWAEEAARLELSKFAPLPQHTQPDEIVHR